MQNERRLIDANAIPWEEWYVPDPDSEEQWQFKKELGVPKPTVDAMPTVDAVEVVRCEACKRWFSTGKRAGNREDGQLIGHCAVACYGRKANDFCSYGERKEQ